MIPTAIELTFKRFPKHSGIFVLRNIEEFMIEFAKLHVEEALKQASRVELDDVELMPEANDFEEARELSILNAYPLTNIK